MPMTMVMATFILLKKLCSKPFQVNQYPIEQGFTAIGTGGDDFVHSMVVSVKSVLPKRVPASRVKRKISSGGIYVSVNIGPVEVVSSEQVQAAVSIAMR